MSKYQVLLIAEIPVVVEANNTEEAKEKAMDELKDASIGPRDFVVSDVDKEGD